MSTLSNSSGLSLFARLPQYDESFQSSGIALQRIVCHYDIEHSGRIYPHGLRLTLEVPMSLADDVAQSVLLAILKLSSLSETSTNNPGPILWPLKNAEESSPFETIATSLHTVATLAGLGDSPEASQRLEYYLKLFALIPIFYDNVADKRSGSSHLISYYVADDTDELLLYLNRRWGSMIFRL